MIGSGVTLIKCSIYGEATDGEGGGFYGSAVLIDSCTIDGTAWFGGGAISGRAASITNTVFRNSATTFGSGGAIDGGAGYMADCTFIGNETGDPALIYSDPPNGGAIAGSVSLMERCSFTGNQSPTEKVGRFTVGAGQSETVFSGVTAPTTVALFLSDPPPSAGVISAATGRTSNTAPFV
jgi:hypothetical protein